MTVKDVERRVAAIERNAGDDEMQHSAEDALYVDVLRTIANGSRNGRALAKAALEADKLKFARWCA